TSPTSDPEQLRAIAFLGDVARLALEGRRRKPDPTGVASVSGVVDARDSRVRVGSGASPPRRIRAAVPERAAVILDRLAGVRKPFSSLDRLLVEFERAASHPLEITPLRRGIHLAIQGFFLLPGLFLMFLLSCPRVRPRAFP